MLSSRPEAPQVRPLRQMILPLAILVAALVAAARPGGASAAPAPGPTPAVALVRGTDYMSRTGQLDLSAVVTLAQPAREMTVRFRVLTQNGTLVFQRTESRERLPAGAAVVRIERSAKALGLKEGSYLLDVHVEASGHTPASITEQILVVDDKRAPVTVAVVVRVRGTPLIGPSGVPMSDPATATLPRDEAVAAAQLRSVRPDIVFTLAIPPVLLDDWRRVAQGYQVARTDTPVSLEATVPSVYRDASRALADAAQSGLVFAEMPYAEPDIGGLERMRAMDDLAAQIALGSRVTSSTLHTATVGTCLDGSPLRLRTARLLGDHGIGWALLSPDSIPLSDGTTPTPGVHQVEGAPLILVVPDAQASALLAGSSTARTEFLSYLLKHASSKKEKGQPVVAVIEVGQGQTASVADLQAALAALMRVRWVRVVSMPEIATMRPIDSLRLPDEPSAVDTATVAYWREIAAARKNALALRAATEPSDEDGVACERAIMLAEGRVFSGEQRETGLRYASEADALATSILREVSLTTPDVTLSGASGKVRASVTNGTGKVLTLAVTATPENMRVLSDPRIVVSAPPGETIISVPVQVRSSLTGALELRLYAGELELAATRSTVAAGFMDRLAIVGSVVLVLLGLLWYIRSRGRQAVAGIREVAGRVPGVGRSKGAS